MWCDVIPLEAFTIEKKIPFEPVAKKPESRHLTTLINDASLMARAWRGQEQKRTKDHVFDFLEVDCCRHGPHQQLLPIKVIKGKD